MTSPILIIGGPTASGKSQLALNLALSFNGVVINADALQLYAALPLLTAQPSSHDLSQAPHALYGILPSDHSSSVGHWLELAHEAIDQAHADRQLPIVVGGTGLYLKSLIYGLATIPPVDPAIRTQASLLLHEKGHVIFHALLAERDPLMAARLHPNDTQRMIRAYEVMEQTGISLATWQEQIPPTRYDLPQFLQYTVMPERTQLYAWCNQRFITMLEKGAVEEVRTLCEQIGDTSPPVTKALGFKQIQANLQGTITLEEATIQAQTITRHYAKRQVTWFRHQLPQAKILAEEQKQWKKIIERDLRAAL